MISNRTKAATFRKLEELLGRMNAAIDAEDARAGEDFLDPEDEDFRSMASSLGEVLDRFWHIRPEQTNVVQP